MCACSICEADTRYCLCLCEETNRVVAAGEVRRNAMWRYEQRPLDVVKVLSGPVLGYHCDVDTQIRHHWASSHPQQGRLSAFFRHPERSAVQKPFEARGRVVCRASVDMLRQNWGIVLKCQSSQSSMGRASVQRAIACVQELNYASNCFSRQMCAAISSQQCAVPRPLTRCVLGLSRDAPAGPNRGLLSIDVRPLSRSLSHSSRSGMPNGVCTDGQCVIDV